MRRILRSSIKNIWDATTGLAVTLRPEKFHNEEAATRTIQALYRRIAARKMLLQLITRQYRKILDPVSGQPCYYDSVSGTATWFKPAVFGEYDLALVDDSTVSPSGRRQSTLVSPRFSALYSTIASTTNVTR
ncbi:uncharacterized protein PITG_09303 [Phytophthora infestans T30-4]|uniref:WW domain-containing protein n=1 Tax=Phytophthora infestans (strain T30-4) TaxID=403677 RepID=D0NBD4_PHYIT|nr:uncharacterized protein PITG_09303 [Phytophthora infestans T30-4]EEY55363.1 conserved hypothetical protein [Phytophthora infestans T30-4]|eukprot:XP_002903587.1 conserved hypothetical protein [Phytophthora infestans T30-4]